MEQGRRGRFHSGTALIEFALTAPLLLTLLAAVLNYGMFLRIATCLADAARAGAQYGSQSAINAQDLAGMQTRAINAEPTISGMSAAASRFCQCPGGASVSCSGSCAGGAIETYVKVTVTADYPAFFRYSGLPYSGALGATAIMRAQ